MDVDIAIIGAGAARIGAARRLAGTGLNMVMIEAAPRIGGRAWNLDLAGLKLDMGCAWLHSADRDVWTSLAERAGVPIHRRLPNWHQQYRDLAFPPAEQDAAEQSFDAWTERLSKHRPQAMSPQKCWRTETNGIISSAPGSQREGRNPHQHRKMQDCEADGLAIR